MFGLLRRTTAVSDGVVPDRDEEQTVAEIVRKVQQIRLLANRSVNELLAGQYRAVFRGRGIEFDGVREYQPGDDVRSIDWNVTARAGQPFIKKFSEERELTVLFLFDISASGAFGSGNESKLDQLIEISALLMFSALRNNDKVGLLMFANKVERYLEPRKGRANILRLIRGMVATRPVASGANIDVAIDMATRLQKRRCVVFVVSDLLNSAAEHSLTALSRRHDVVAVSISDPREHELPNVGMVSLRDAETGAVRHVDTSSKRVRETYAANAIQREAGIDAMLSRAGIDRIAISTDEPYLQPLRRFFRSRESRGR